MTRDRPGKYHLYHEAVQATWLGLVVNLLLGCAKLAGGLVGRSYALISDAVNSLGDVFTSVAVLLAFRVAQKPADAEHPYGHTRAEAIAGSNVAVLVIVSALLVGWGALQGFSQQAHEVPPVWTLAIAGSNVVIKEALGAIPKRGDFDSAIRSLFGATCDKSVEDPRSAFNFAGKIHLPTTVSGESAVSENLAPDALEN